MQSLPVGDGVRMGYIDSGVPVVENKDPYATIFTIHGWGFAGSIYTRVMNLAQSSNVRIVAVNRRNYSGSTPISLEEEESSATGTDEEKERYWDARGIEILEFIDAFIEKHRIPPINLSGNGGVAIAGWSGGSAFAFSAIANVERLNASRQAHFSKYIRGVLLQEPPSIILGYPMPPGTWSPEIDPSIPLPSRKPMYIQWITSYFQHGDLSTRNFSNLEYIVPALFRHPTIYNMTPDERRDIVDEGVNEIPGYLGSGPQLNALFKKAFFDKGIQELLPSMKRVIFAGDVTCSFCLAGLWQIQEEYEKIENGTIRFELVSGVNHFMQWDDPEICLGMYVRALE